MIKLWVAKFKGDMDKRMCIWPTFLCQGTKKGHEGKAWQKLVGSIFCFTLDGAARDVTTARFYNHFIVW